MKLLPKQAVPVERNIYINDDSQSSNNQNNQGVESSGIFDLFRSFGAGLYD